MKIVIKILLFLGIVSSVFFACDDIEEPFIESKDECGDASMSVPIKQILIEEITGHKCGNCPEGDKSMEELKDIYCDHVIPISIHAGAFASINTTEDKYSYDYRTEDGNEINEYFNASNSGIPNAMINRTPVNDDLTLNPSYWATVVADMLDAEPVLDITVSTSYISDTRNLNIDVDVVFIESMNENLMLSVYFVEDSVVSWQKDYNAEDNNQDIEFYPHNHVLRDAVNGAWGNEIVNGQINQNDVISKSFTYKVDQEWRIKNSSIVAFVYKNETKEVLQASQKHIMD
ncbi:MAG: Omp28 family outer membrane lipoprotein [Bacteroidales bacterium]|jgi:hypothetical protein|nr:Omp28 family outer membrane lipoprotein [Bacteroidales bacterium]